MQTRLLVRAAADPLDSLRYASLDHRIVVIARVDDCEINFSSTCLQLAYKGFCVLKRFVAIVARVKHEQRTLEPISISDGRTGAEIGSDAGQNTAHRRLIRDLTDANILSQSQVRKR